MKIDFYRSIVTVETGLTYSLCKGGGQDNNYALVT